MSSAVNSYLKPIAQYNNNENEFAKDLGVAKFYPEETSQRFTTIDNLRNERPDRRHIAGIVISVALPIIFKLSILFTIVGTVIIFVREYNDRTRRKNLILEIEQKIKTELKPYEDLIGRLISNLETIQIAFKDTIKRLETRCNAPQVVAQLKSIGSPTSFPSLVSDDDRLKPILSIVSGEMERIRSEIDRVMLNPNLQASLEHASVLAKSQEAAPAFYKEAVWIRMRNAANACNKETIILSKLKTWFPGIESFREQLGL